jgi:hypothetical protein
MQKKKDSHHTFDEQTIIHGHDKKGYSGRWIYIFIKIMKKSFLCDEAIGIYSVLGISVEILFLGYIEKNLK